MSEFGFYHPTRGYWQTTGAPSEATLSTYPEGTSEVPLKPGAYHEWDGATWGYTTPTPSAASIDDERDRRISSGFTFDGVVYQTRPEDRENMAGAATSALAAIMNGAQVGDLYWHGGAAPFAWIAEDNSLTEMDAQTMLAFGQAAMAHKQAHIFAARTLKDMSPIPQDYASASYWPS